MTKKPKRRKGRLSATGGTFRRYEGPIVTEPIRYDATQEEVEQAMRDALRQLEKDNFAETDPQSGTS